MGHEKDSWEYYISYSGLRIRVTRRWVDCWDCWGCCMEHEGSKSTFEVPMTLKVDRIQGP